MQQEICVVRVRLFQSFGPYTVSLWAEQQYAYLNQKISRAVVIWRRKKSESMTSAAQGVFISLGYDQEKTDGHRVAEHCCKGDHSQYADSLRPVHLTGPKKIQKTLMSPKGSQD